MSDNFVLHPNITIRPKQKQKASTSTSNQAISTSTARASSTSNPAAAGNTHQSSQPSSPVATQVGASQSRPVSPNRGRSASPAVSAKSQGRSTSLVPSSRSGSPMDWLSARLANQCGCPDDISQISPYEASLYGPINALLYSCFDIHYHYMIKPQGILRYKPNSSEGGRTAAVKATEKKKPRTSLGVTGGQIRYIPDFMVVKACEDTDKDILISVIEIKKKQISQAEKEEAEIQLKNYLIYAAKVSDTKNLIKVLTGFLVIGDMTTKMELDVSTLPKSSGNAITNQELALVKKCVVYETDSPNFRDDLKAIAGKYKTLVYSPNRTELPS